MVTFDPLFNILKIHKTIGQSLEPQFYTINNAMDKFKHIDTNNKIMCGQHTFSQQQTF